MTMKDGDTAAYVNVFAGGIWYLDLRWITEQRYWIVYTASDPLVIAGVFRDTTTIPNRI